MCTASVAFLCTRNKHPTYGLAVDAEPSCWIDYLHIPIPEAEDRLSLLLGATVLQKYAVARRAAVPAKSGLAPWQRRRATELLRKNLDGRVRLAEVAKECRLPVSHFARSFKTTFGISSHQWLIQRRIERAKELLANAGASLVDVAVECGFGDQAAFTRSFHQVAGTSPGRWRREHADR